MIKWEEGFTAGVNWFLQRFGLSLRVRGQESEDIMDRNQGNETGDLVCAASQRKTNSYTLTALILVILLASLFRLYNLGEHSLWFDEAVSVCNVRSILRLPPFEDWGLSYSLTRDRLPPLYSFLIMPFYYLSQSTWVMRLASVVWGIASIPLVYYFGARLFNKKIGLVGALLLAFSPFHVYYSQELRPYSLFLFLSTLIFYLSYLALEDNKSIYYTGMIAASVLGIYTHTYTVFPLFIVNLYFVLGWKAYHHLLRRWLLSHLAIVVLCIPAFYLVIYHITTGKTELASFPSGLRSIVGTFYLFTIGRLFFPTPSNLIFIVVQGAIWGVGLLMGIWALWREKASERGRQLLSFFLAVAITYAAIWLFSLRIMPLFDEARVNYLIFLVPAYYLLVARGWDGLSSSALKATLVGLAVLISLISMYPFYFEWDQVGKGNFRAAAEYVQHNLEENDVIYHVEESSAMPFSYYFDWQVPQIKITAMGNANYISHDRIWLVVLKQKGGFEFGLELFQKQQIGVQEKKNNAISVCADYIKDEKFHLIDFKAFPGKNELTVCLYRREDPNSP